MDLFSISLPDGTDNFVPPAIFGIGLNYKAYAESIGKPLPEYPLVFMKQGNCVIGNRSAIELPGSLPTEEVDYEGELAVVIGRTCRNCTQANAFDFVAGYTCANDVSARDWQFKKGQGQFCRGKTFDTFCPIGPRLVPITDIPNPQNLTLRTRVNGQLRQHGHTSDMIFSVAQIISFLSSSTTLLPGTVILTGTPGGTGSGQTPPNYLKVGDLVEVEIDGIGCLSNPVIAERRLSDAGSL
jgi:2-keto-4-pentenoate hydratase/2-oxohepta-3-ene-1,7-dioic acid hydratase in catechol pathway